MVFDPQSLAAFEDEAVLEGVRQWLSRHDNTPWLLIFDNYDGPDMCDVEKVNGSFVPVKPFWKIEDSLAVLQTRSGRVNVVLDPRARRLAERLGGLPLALATTGAYSAHSPWSFEKHFAAYEERWNIHSRTPMKLPEYHRTLYTTWNLSYEQLQQQEPGAARLLKLLAYFDNQSIWPSLLQGGRYAKQYSRFFRVLLHCWRKAQGRPIGLLGLLADDVDLEHLMNILSRHCFFEIQIVTRSYSMHSCIHDWTLEELNREVDLRSYWYALDCAAASIDVGDLEALTEVKYVRISRHAVRPAHHQFESCDEPGSGSLERLQKIGLIALMLQEQVQYSAAAKMFRRALAGFEMVLGPDHSSTLDIVHNLGLVYTQLGKLDEAEHMYMRALAGCEKALGPDHILTLTTVHNLGVLHIDQGDLLVAEQMCLRVLTGREKVLGLDHISTLDAVDNLGVLCRDQGKLDEAEQLYRRALTGYEKQLGRDHPRTYTIVGNLDAIRRRQGSVYMNLAKLKDQQEKTKAEITVEEYSIS